jgi:hypothetical protein
MRISDARCEEFRQLCRAQCGQELSLVDARDEITSIVALLERFAAWAARAKAAGRLAEQGVGGNASEQNAAS